MHSIKFFKVGDEVKRLTPTEEQFKAIVESIRSQKLSDTAEPSANLVEFIGQAGLGQAECDGLLWKDINFDANNITLIRRKTKKQFSIPIYPMLRPLLERMSAERSSKNPDEKVFMVLGRREAASLLDAMAALPRKWVKPEVDPPRIYALPRGVLMGGFL